MRRMNTNYSGCRRLKKRTRSNFIFRTFAKIHKLILLLILLLLLNSSSHQVYGEEDIPTESTIPTSSLINNGKHTTTATSDKEDSASIQTNKGADNNDIREVPIDISQEVLNQNQKDS